MGHDKRVHPLVHHPAVEVMSQARLGFVHGLKSVPTALGIISRRPRILLWLVPPLLITLLLDVVAFYFAFGWMREGIGDFVGSRGYVTWVTGAMNVFAAVAVVLLLGWAFAWMFLVLASPFQDFIPAAVEQEQRGNAPKQPVGFRGFLRGMVRGAVQGAVLLLITVPVLILGFLPVIGPVLVFLWSAFAMGFSFATIPAGRLRERFALARRHRGVMLGLGAVIALAALVPLLNVLCMPVFVVAGTLVYLQATGAVSLPSSAGEV